MLRKSVIIAMFSAIFIIGSITILSFDGGINQNDPNPIPKKWRNIRLYEDSDTQELAQEVAQEVEEEEEDRSPPKPNWGQKIQEDDKQEAFMKNGAYFLNQEFKYEVDSHFTVGVVNKIDKYYQEHHEEIKKKQDAVRNGMKFAWDKYAEYAWGHDELRPLSKVAHDWFGLGLTIVDSIDTLYLMDLKDEYKRAKDWIATELELSAHTGHTVSVFETHIRFLGGFLSIYELTNEPIFLEKAKEIGHLLIKAYVNVFPRTSINLGSGNSNIASWSGGCVVLAEFATTFIELEHLSRLSGDPIFYEKSRAIINKLDSMTKKTPGLYPIYAADDGSRFCGDLISLGAMGDSFYEYLVKMWLYYDKKEHIWQRMYMESTDSVIKNMYKVSKAGFGYLPNYQNGHSYGHQEHLTCFAGGMFALGAAHNITGNETLNNIHFHVGKQIAKTCAESYMRTGSGLGPEAFGFDNDGFPSAHASGSVAWYILRPEAAESVFIMWRLTGDTQWLDYGWKMFQAIEKHCRMENGYAGVKDVNTGEQKDDLQQSFFMAETFKYLYLLFSNSSLIPLDKYVFNTEAHPIPIQKKF